MPAAAVISSGVHERSIAVVKTFLVDMIREVCEGSWRVCAWGFCPCVRVRPAFPSLQPQSASKPAAAP